ncbi:MAG: hypothetical protein JKY50_04915 [Oleispira sp.]|nr:hypothetical protein [Oleispira sp.]
MADWHLSRVGAPATEPLTLKQVKSDRGGIEHTLHDDDFNLYIQAARESAESKTGRAFVDQKWQQIFSKISVEDSALPLIRWPIKSIDKVLINGIEVDHSTFDFLPGDDSSIESGQFVGQKVTVVYSAGYGGADDVPAAVKKWMLATIGTMYEHRESEVVGTIVSRVSYVDSLLSLYRIRRFW